MTTNPAPPAWAAWLERRQVLLCLGAIALGAALGLTIPGSPAAAVAITPILGLLLFATFLAVPLADLARGFRDTRFLLTLCVVDFVVAPLLVFGLSRFVADSDALLIGLLLVLLTPCVDYVIVFAGLAGGSSARLLAATPVLMIAQLLLLPVYLTLFGGPTLVALVDPAPFVEAFVFLILLPLLTATVVQLAARRSRVAVALMSIMQTALVPLMLATLLVVVASQIRGVVGQVGALLVVLPLFIVFIVVMVPVGALAARVARLDVPGARAVTFSGVTRNSLVVLPLALALPAHLALAPIVVVTQTLVELLGLAVLVRLVPRLIRSRERR
ncbi:arsenic resistance protein [Plantibacter flavus]|uniref:arsenic resistance protein n=1 Tax=Plantibacter flavus TaxID=150123 RepID=UPI003F165AF1